MKDIDKPVYKSNFLRQIIESDLAEKKYQKIITRFPPEPNGYLHIGHAKAICISYGLAEDYDGEYHLRFDDTNPVAEKDEFVESIQRDIRWLGFDWKEHLYFASDYFDRMYELAVGLINNGLAYVDSLTRDEIREYRGTLSEKGENSPYRDRSIDENLALFQKMKNGEFKNGEVVLRAKINMSSPNIVMRDPIIYRVLHAHHHRQGDKWKIYPMYDYAHCLEDAFEHITHSLCSLEFKNNRELYDWFIEKTGLKPKPHQYEFARLNLGYTVMSKRKLKQLVEENHVSGWDDPRMPTLAGMRRRGIPASAVREFCDMIGVSKAESLVDVGMFEFAIRDALNTSAPRVMCVLDPLKLTITNYEGEDEKLDCAYWPRGMDTPKGEAETRKVNFSNTLYIEKSDFSETPPKKWKRLEIGVDVRLRYAYIIKVNKVIKNDDGEIIELLATYEKNTKSGADTSGKKVRRVVHWVDALSSLEVKVQIYDRLFTKEKPGNIPEVDFLKELNPKSLITKNARIESSVKGEPSDRRYQFERHGYFWQDLDSTASEPIFNRIVSLKDSWEKSKKSDAQLSKRAPTKKMAKGSASVETLTWRDRVRENDARLRVRYESYQEKGVKKVDADVLSGSLSLSNFFQDVTALFNDEKVDDKKFVHEKTTASWIVNVMLPFYEDDYDFSALPISANIIAKIVQNISENKITAAAGKKLFEMLFNGDKRELSLMIEEEGFSKVTDENIIEQWIQEAIEENPTQAEMYRAGKDALFGFFVGQVMKKSKGVADGKIVKEILKRQL